VIGTPNTIAPILPLDRPRHVVAAPFASSLGTGHDWNRGARAEELGLPELWVTENTVDDCACLDPVVALTFAPSITKRIGLGAAVIVLRSITADGGPSVGNPRFH
jgi:alkanesulfonate monooxygenase SsuD/methylene tetrahydromethanopterin reductase-like flavin-dependent oxidoreductase (luciferase family)